MKEQSETLENQDIEIRLVIEAIYQKYGYDFRNYSQAHVKRRLLNRFYLSGLKTISDMIPKLLEEPKFVEEILMDLSITVTEMFRDPTFYDSIRQEVLPLFHNQSFLKIWHAGCASGEEVYSMAILLSEEGLYKKTQIYATDFNPRIIQQAREAVFPSDRIREFATSYRKSGGKHTFSDYFTAHEESVVLLESLKKNILFATHNLVTDSVFAEVNMIVCRNVLIYFNKQLQEKVLQLFLDSLAMGGILCLGSKENLQFSKHYDLFEPINKNERIYCKRNSC